MTVTVHGGDDATARLEELGLKEEWFRQALIRGDAEAQAVSPSAPKGFKGTTRWGRTAEFLREDLCANGFFADDTYNLARSVHPSGEMCIVVTTGAKGTGVEDAHPDTKYTKGAGVAACVESNYTFDYDSDFVEGVGGPVEISAEMQTWLLLFVVEGDTIRYELSLPEAISPDGHITAWIERIIPAPIDLGPDDPMAGNFEEPTGPVVVPVSRR